MGRTTRAPAAREARSRVFISILHCSRGRLDMPVTPCGIWAPSVAPPLPEDERARVGTPHASSDAETHTPYPSSIFVLHLSWGRVCRLPEPGRYGIAQLGDTAAR